MSLLDANALLGNLYIASRELGKAIKAFESILLIVKAKKLVFTHPYELKAHSALVQLYEVIRQPEKATLHCLAIGEMTPWQDEVGLMPLYRAAIDFNGNDIAGRSGHAEVRFDITDKGFAITCKLLIFKGFIKFELRLLKQ